MTPRHSVELLKLPLDAMSCGRPHRDCEKPKAAAHVMPWAMDQPTMSEYASALSIPTLPKELCSTLGAAHGVGASCSGDADVVQAGVARLVREDGLTDLVGGGEPRAALVDPTATKRWDRLSPGGSEERRGRGNGTKESNTHVVRSAENCTRTVCEPVFCR